MPMACIPNNEPSVYVYIQSSAGTFLIPRQCDHHIFIRFSSGGLEERLIWHDAHIVKPRENALNVVEACASASGELKYVYFA